jgi:beta-carotene 3-hydroxylase
MMLLKVLIVLGSFIAMEGVAWFSHKYIMHGWLWRLHSDHHHRQTHGFLEKNDYFFLLFATPGIMGLFLGLKQDFSLWFWVGLGITIYGLSYFIVHDVFIHQRIKYFKKTDSTYFRAIRKAHKVHHKHLEKEEGECFGMLWVPLKYFKEAKRASTQ